MMAVAHVEPNRFALAQFTTQAKGIRLYEVDCNRVRVGMTVMLRRNPSRYDYNAVDLIITSLQENLFFGHLAKDAARFISLLLSEGFHITG